LGESLTDGPSRRITRHRRSPWPTGSFKGCSPHRPTSVLLKPQSRAAARRSYGIDSGDDRGFQFATPGPTAVVMLAERISVTQRSRTLKTGSGLLPDHRASRVVCSNLRQDRGYLSASVESAAPPSAQRTASGCACQRHAWTTSGQGVLSPICRPWTSADPLNRIVGQPEVAMTTDQTAPPGPRQAIASHTAASTPAADFSRPVAAGLSSDSR
jgi:hypothetical protein